MHRADVENAATSSRRARDMSPWSDPHTGCRIAFGGGHGRRAEHWTKVSSRPPCARHNMARNVAVLRLLRHRIHVGNENVR